MAATPSDPNAVQTPTPPPGKDGSYNDLFGSGTGAMDDFFDEASNFTNVLPPEVGNPAPILQGNATSDGDNVAFPYTDVPEISTPGQTVIPQPQGPGFGPIVPDTTTDPINADTQVPLFTEENMGADQTGDFLQGYADRAPEVAANETMQGQLEQILNQDNALFDWARGQAAQYANSRGLLNSDIAAEASSQAVMGAALPIAQFDATVYAQAAAQERSFWHTAGLQAFDATIQSGLMAQDHMNRMVEMSHQGDINSRLQLEQFGYNWQLSEQDNMHQMQQLALQGDIQSRLALQQFGFDVSLMEQDFGYRVKLADIDLRNALRLSEQDHGQWLDRMAQDHVNNLSQIAASGQQQRAAIAAQGEQSRRLQDQADQAALDRLRESGQINADQADRDAANQSERDAEQFGLNLQQRYMDEVGNRNRQFSAEIQNIYSNPGLTAQQQTNAVSVARRNYENDIAMLGRMYSSNPNWDPRWEVSPMSTPGGTLNPPPGSGPPPIGPPGPPIGPTPPPPGNQPPPIGPPGPGVGPEPGGGQSEIPPWKLPNGNEMYSPVQQPTAGRYTPSKISAPTLAAPGPAPTRTAPTTSGGGGIRSGGARR
jgi:hypothetical protein